MISYAVVRHDCPIVYVPHGAQVFLLRIRHIELRLGRSGIMKPKPPYRVPQDRRRGGCGDDDGNLSGIRDVVHRDLWDEFSDCGCLDLSEWSCCRMEGGF